MFRFALKPLNEVQLWGEPGDQSLHWYALTDGYYFIEAGTERILWYSETACRAQGWEFPPTPHGFEWAASYHLCRLFEDVAQVVPAVLEPVPDDVAQILDNAEDHRKYDDFVNNWDWQDDTEDGLLWVSQRTIDTAYLRAGPWVTFWRTGDTIRVRCDNRLNLLDGVQIWSAELVEHELPVDDFLASLHEFGDSLLQAMDKRVQEAEGGWSLPNVRLDATELRRDHTARIAQWKNTFSCHQKTDWDVVRRSWRG